MRSVTSCFNPTLYRKNLARFWPIWVAWTALWAFIYPLNLLNEWRRYMGGDEHELYRFFRSCLNLNDVLYSGGMVFGVIYAALVVMAVFSYLYNHRSAAALHALPMRRESHFVTNFLSGLTFLVLPNLVVFLTSALVELVALPAHLSGIAIPCLWSAFWMKTGTEFFFYCFAVFCAQFTGNVFALPAFYAILNGLVVVMYTMIRELGNQILYGGWPWSSEPFFVKLLTPIYTLMEALNWDYVSWDQVWNSELVKPEISAELDLTFADPGLVGGYAVAGVVFAALALLVYRRRNIETAGDVVSVKIVRPIFRAGVAACAGLCGGMVTAAFFGEMDRAAFMIACVVFWAAVGHYAAEMLLQKSFRVWKKAWKSCAATVLAMVLVMAGLYLDVLGMETWIPDTDKVEEMCITVNSTYPYDKASYVAVVPGDEVERERIVDLHKSILRDYEQFGANNFGDEIMNVSLTYTMENGVTYSKRYYDVRLILGDIEIPDTTTYRLDQFINDPAVIREAYGWEQALNSRIVCTRLEDVIHPDGSYESVDGGDAGAEEIWAAVQADFAAGNLGRRYLFEDEVRLSQTYRTDLRLCFWSSDGPNSDVEYYEYYETYAPSVTYACQTVEDKELHYNWSFDITLTPMATNTLAALEKYYPGLGEDYAIAEHEME